MVRGQRGSDCGGGTAGAADGGTRREGAGERMGSPRGRRRRWQGCIYLPYSQYTKVPRSTRYAADSSRWQSTLLGSGRENGGERGQNKKKSAEREREGAGERVEERVGGRERGKRETEVKARGKSATRVRRSLSGNVGDRGDKSRRPTRRRMSVVSR